MVLLMNPKTQGDHMKKITLKSILGFMLIGAISISHAASVKRYQINLIFFQQLNVKALQSEHFPLYFGHNLNLDNTLDWPLTDTKNPVTVDPASPDTQNTAAFTWMDLSSSKLGNALKRLKRQNDIQVLGYTSLSFDADDVSKTRRIHLYGGTQSDLMKKNNRWPVNGIMSIKLNRYFNLGFNLTFNVDTDTLKSLDSQWNTDNQRTDISAFQFKNNRRMRSQQINYIDNPLFGVLVLISPTDSD